MLSFLVWNCRGAVSKGFAAALKNLVRLQKPRFIVLLKPRISGTKARRVIQSLGFRHSELVEAEGFGGGIWLLWNDSQLKVEVLEKHMQFMHS